MKRKSEFLNLGDLESLNDPKKPEETVTLRNLQFKNVDKNFKIKQPFYEKYEQWDESMRESDQFNWPLQRLNKAEQQFYNCNSTDCSDFPLLTLDIEKDIMDDFTICLIGRRRSGKSFMAKWIMYHLRHRFPAGIVISGTKQNKFWSQCIPDEFIHDVKDMNLVLDAVFKRQKFILEHPELGIDPRFFIIMDDVLKEKYMVRFSKLLSQSFTDGRHYKIFLMLLVQDPRAIPPTLRENTDLGITFRMFQKGRKESVCTDFIDYLPNKQQQMEFLWGKTGLIDTKTGEKLDEEHSTEDEIRAAVPVALCVLQARMTENLQHIFKQCIAEEPPEFVIGNENYWKVMKSGRWLSLKDSFENLAEKK